MEYVQKSEIKTLSQAYYLSQTLFGPNVQLSQGFGFFGPAFNGIFFLLKGLATREKRSWCEVEADPGKDRGGHWREHGVLLLRRCAARAQRGGVRSLLNVHARFVNR